MSLVDFFRKKKKIITDSAKTSLGNFANEVKTKLQNANKAPDWMVKADMGMEKFSQKAANFPKFNFAEKVNNPIGRFAATIPQEIMNIPSRTIRGSLRDYGKFKATPSYLIKRGAEAANIGVDIGSTFAGGGTAKKLITDGFKQTTKTGIMDVVKTGAKRGLKEGTIYGGTSGAFSGVQEGENLKEQGINALKSGAIGSAVGGGAGLVLGGTMAGGGRVAKNTKDGIKKEVMNISGDIHNFKNPYKKRIVNETKEIPTGAILDGKEVTMSIPTGKRYIQTIKDPFKAKSITGKVLTARPGLNIQDVYANKPKIISQKPLKRSTGVMDFNNRIALKNQKAAELVNNQKTNQKLNLNKTEEGFILPKDVKAPEVKNNIGKYELTDDDYRRASDAHNWSSFNPERAGKTTIESTRDFVENTYKELAPIAEKNGTLDNFNAYFERFKANVRKNSDKTISAKSRTASSAITGGSGFNVGRNQKYMDYYENAFKRYMDESDKGVNILKKIAHNVQKPVRVGDSEAGVKIKSELERLIEKQNAFKEINRRLRKGENIESVLSSYPEEIIEGNRGAKYYLRERGLLDGKSIPGFALSNLNSNIKRLQSKAKVAEKIQNVEIPENIIPDAITTIDREANRLRISHPQRPDAQVIADMKSMGLRWSPFNKAWQAPVTPRLLYKIKTYSQNLKPEEVKPVVIPKNPIQEEAIKVENPFIQPKKNTENENFVLLGGTKPDLEKRNAIFADIEKGKKYNWKYNIGDQVKAEKGNMIIGDRYIVDGKARYTVYPPGYKNSKGYHHWEYEGDLANRGKMPTIKTEEKPIGGIYTKENVKNILDQNQENNQINQLYYQLRNFDGDVSNILSDKERRLIDKFSGNKVIQESKQLSTNDAHDIQEIKNSILEGKTILRAGSMDGRKLSDDELRSIARSVENAQAKIGVEAKDGYKIQEISSDTIFGKNEGFSKDEITKEGLRKWNVLVKQGKAGIKDGKYYKITESAENKTNPFIQPKKQVIQEEIKTENPFLPEKSNSTPGLIQETSPVIKPEPEVKPKIEENAIEKLREYQKYKKETIEKFINSEDGYKMMAEAEVKGDMFDPINENVYKGIKSNPFFRKEKQIDESMGEGFLLEKNGRFLVANAQKADEYAQKGWTKRIEIDSLANEAGFEKGSDYLDFILNKGDENKAITSPRTIARRELIKDPAYAELEREIKRLTPIAKEQKALMPKIEKNPFMPKAKSVKELIQESPFSGNEFNEFQQRAYQAKGERIKNIGEVLNRGNELLRIGYRKNEINRKGIDEIKRIEKLSKLGYPKAEIDKMDFDRMDLIINKEVPWSSLKDYYERKHALDTNFLRDIDPTTLKDISPLQAGFRDAYRNFETVFGKDYPKIKERLLNPLDEAKGKFIDDQRALLNEVEENIVKRLGIKKGSAEDKAVVMFGEGKIGEQELMKKFPNNWRNIVEADKWFKTKYPLLLSDLNMTREAFFPTHPLYPESTKIIPERKDYYRHGKDLEGINGLKNLFEGASSIDPSLAVASDITNPKTKWLSFAQRRKGNDNDFGAVEGYLDYVKNYSFAKNIDPYIQKIKGVDDEAKTELSKGQFFHETTGLAEELAKKMDPIQKITDSKDPQKIRDILIGNKVTESQADWMSRELAGLDNYQEVKNFIRNKTSKNKENILENMGLKSQAEGSENKLNNFLVFIKNYSRDLAGKTNPIDRPFQENVLGRKWLGIWDFANKRFKANAVLGNLSSSLAQFFNIPQGIASAGAKNSIKGVKMSLADVFSDKTPINKSNFFKERYFKDYNRFDDGVLADTKKFAVWMTGVGDKIGTRFIWNSHYEKAINNGISNPVKYADDWTRKMVAGRGIGEVPIAQKAKITQMLAPFQLEVANMWFALKDIAKDDPRKMVLAKKMIEFTVASYLMNRAVKAVRGSDVSFDPINAMMEAYNEYQEEDNKLTGAVKAGGRMAGEVISNIPGGQTLASMYPEYGFGINKETFPTAAKLLNNPRKELMGEGDPTRFGTGGLPMFSAIKNPLTGLITPYGGRQIEKTYSGAKTLLNGYAENKTGKVMTPVDRDATNIMRGVLFGKNALGEVQNYYKNKQTPLSDLQTEKFKLMGNDKNYFNSIATSREAGKEKEKLKAGKETANAMKLSDEVYQLSNGKYYVKSLDKEFDTAQKAERELNKEDFRLSDENFRDLGDRVLRKSEDGTVSELSRNKFDSMLYSARLILYKKNGDLKKWVETADKQLEALSNSLNDPSIDELEKVKIESELETLMDNYQKYQGYGGFTKPKKAKAIDEKYKYPLVNMDFIKIKELLSGINSKPRAQKQYYFIPRKRVTKVSRRR